MFIAIKTDDGRIKGKNSFYCRALHVSRQAFNKYLKTKATPWKYQPLADAMVAICREDECNDTYGRIRMYQALQLKQPEGVDIPGERTVYRVMEEIGLTHKPKRKPNGITKADKEARKSDDLIKRDFSAEKPLEKCITDMTEIKVDCQHFFRQIFLGYFSDIVQAFDTLRKNVCGDDYTSLHNPIVLSSVLPAYGMFHSIQILFL